MRVTVAEPRYTGGLRIVSIVGLAVLVMLSLYATNQDGVKLGAALFLIGLAPGLLFTGWLFPEQNILERLVLSVGSSFALSALVLLVVAIFVGPLTDSKVILSLAGLLAVLTVGSLLSWGHTRVASAVAKHIWLSLLLALIVAGTLRLPGLGDAEFQDDEIDVGNAVHQVIRGNVAGLFQDRRGPAQTLITAAVYLITGKPHEWILRAPVALANLAAIAGLFILAWSMFNWRIALVSSLLLSLEGFVLAYSLVVQMQSTLLLMMILSTFCLYRAYKTAEYSIRTRYVALGSLFFAFGLLAHYEMILMAPVLAYLYAAPYGWNFWRRNRIGLVIAAALVLVVAGGFYAPFVLNPAFRTTYGYYSQDIVGRGLRNNLHEFMLVGTFYNSLYYFGALWLLLGLTCIVQLCRAFGASVSKRWLTIGIGVGAWVILSADLLGFPVGLWWSLAACISMAVLCLLPKRVSVEMRTLFLWFFGFFTLYSFVLREVHVHYYVYSMPWTLLSTLGLAWLYKRGLSFVKRFQARWASVYSFVAAICFGLFLLLCAGYAWLVFVQPFPEYALTFPQFKNPLYLTTYAHREGEAFGFAHQSGWKTIGYLYRTGALRGRYETNELYLTAEWYTRRFIRDDQPPRYYFVAIVPHRLQASPWPPPLDQKAYHPIGTVTVMGQPRLQMYERNEFPNVGPVKIYATETYDTLYDRMATVKDVQREEQFQADDQFFREVANYLESVAQPDDGLLLNLPQQANILSYYYQGNLPYYLPTPTGVSDVVQRNLWLTTIIAKHHPHLYALFWGEQAQDPTGQFEIWLNQQLFKLDEQWFGNLRLVRYDVPEKALSKTLEHQLPMTLGEQIRFLGYNLTQQDNLHLSLFWQAAQPIEQRYKVFVHLLDHEHKIVSQNDSEPGGNRHPTDSWKVNDGAILDNYALTLPAELPKGQFSLEIGMYNPAKGERLPVLDAQQQRQPNDAIVFAIVIK
ncbi:hypothetical protein BH10CHL1_BH10CHL1_13130 [soil metagenome]